MARRRKSPHPITNRRLMPLKDAAARLGMSKLTLRDWVLAGKVASHKVGGKVLLSDVEVERIIAESERPRVA